MESFDFSWSNFVLKIGGQLLIIVVLLMILFFGNTMQFPKEEVRQMMHNVRL